MTTSLTLHTLVPGPFYAIVVSLTQSRIKNDISSGMIGEDSNNSNNNNLSQESVYLQIDLKYLFICFLLKFAKM
jgi:hypothetical protein